MTKNNMKQKCNSFCLQNLKSYIFILAAGKGFLSYYILVTAKIMFGSIHTYICYYLSTYICTYLRTCLICEYRDYKVNKIIKNRVIYLEVFLWRLLLINLVSKIFLSSI